jgi:hypothetical protein
MTFMSDFGVQKTSRAMTERGWHRTFDDPIPLPDAASCARCPTPATTSPSFRKKDHDTPAWRTAIEALMLVAEHGGDTVLPRIGMMRALYPGGTAPTLRKKRAKRYRIVG